MIYSSSNIALSTELWVFAALRRARADVYMFVARHLILRNIIPIFNLGIPLGSQHDAQMKKVFSQPRWLSRDCRFLQPESL